MLDLWTIFVVIVLLVAVIVIGVAYTIRDGDE